MTELIVILLIAIILTVLSVPSFISFIQNHRLITTAENVYYALQYARSEAVKRNTTVYFSVQTGDNWCYGINSGSACDCTIANNCNIATFSTPKIQQISFSTSGLTNNAIYFESTHGAANANGSITLTVYGQTNLITLSIGRLGHLQMCSTGIGGYTAC